MSGPFEAGPPSSLWVAAGCVLVPLLCTFLWQKTRDEEKFVGGRIFQDSSTSTPSSPTSSHASSSSASLASGSSRDDEEESLWSAHERRDTVYRVKGAGNVQILGRRSDASAPLRCPFVSVAVLKHGLFWRPRFQAIVLSSLSHYRIGDIAQVNVLKANNNVLKIWALVDVSELLERAYLLCPRVRRVSFSVCPPSVHPFPVQFYSLTLFCLGCV